MIFAHGGGLSEFHHVPEVLFVVGSAALGLKIWWWRFKNRK